MSATLNVIAWIMTGLLAGAVVALPLLLLRSRGYLGGRKQTLHQGRQVPLWRMLPLWLFVLFQTFMIASRLLGGSPSSWWVLGGTFFLLGMVIWSQVEGFIEAVGAARRERSDQDSRTQAYLRELSGGHVTEAEQPAA